MEDKKINIRFNGLGTLLGIAFIILKLCKVIDWAWIWVLAPFWIGWAISLFLLLIFFIIALCQQITEKINLTIHKFRDIIST